MIFPLFQSTIDSLRDAYESGDAPSYVFFESCSYQGYTIDEVRLMISKEAAKKYAQYIYDKEK